MSDEHKIADTIVNESFPKVFPGGSREATQMLVRAILEQYRLPLDGVHGIPHWARVYENGQLVAHQSGVRQDVAALFAVFHDACRHNESADPNHGRRGSELAKRMRGSLFEIDDEGFDLLVQACNLHTFGRTRADPAVQSCWDSDRLDLSRAGIMPYKWLLCTQAARRPEVMQWAYVRSLQVGAPDWIEDEWGIQMPNGH